MKDYLEFEFVIDKSNDIEVVMAWLGQLPFDSLWEDSILKGYMPKEEWCENIQKELESFIPAILKSYQFSEVEKVNWNQRWESDFQPVEVGDFCRVRASFHAELPGFQHEITINPKMSFGTGHHATTFMMIESMKELNFSGKSVLDYGSGTGILAILAAKMQAAQVIGVEIETIAVENSDENKELNNQPNIRFIEGQLDDVPELAFDIILANINRNVLLTTMPEMKAKLAPQGTLIISGILKEDESIMQNAIQEYKLKLEQIRNRGDWCCMVLKHN